MESAKGTAWGLVNGVTFHYDHQGRNKTQDGRLDSAWFGAGATMKARVLEEALAAVGNYA